MQAPSTAKQRATHDRLSDAPFATRPLTVRVASNDRHGEQPSKQDQASPCEDEKYGTIACASLDLVVGSLDAQDVDGAHPARRRALPPRRLDRRGAAATGERMAHAFRFASLT